MPSSFLFLKMPAFFTLFCYLHLIFMGPVFAVDQSYSSKLSIFCADQLEVAKFSPPGWPVPHEESFLPSVVGVFRKEVQRWKAAKKSYPEYPLSSSLVRKWEGGVTYFWNSASQAVEPSIPDPESYAAIERRLDALTAAVKLGEVSWDRKVVSLENPELVAASFVPSELPKLGNAENLAFEQKKIKGGKKFLRRILPGVLLLLPAGLAGFLTGYESRKINESRAYIETTKKEVSEEIVAKRKKDYNVSRFTRELLTLEAKMYEEVGYSEKLFHFTEQALKLVAKAKDPQAKDELVTRFLKEHIDFEKRYNLPELGYSVLNWHNFSANEVKAQPFYESDVKRIKAIDKEERGNVLYTFSLIFEIIFTLLAVGRFFYTTHDPVISEEPVTPRKVTPKGMEKVLVKKELPPLFQSFLRWLRALKNPGSLPSQTGHFAISAPLGIHIDIFARMANGKLELVSAVWKSRLDFIEPGESAKAKFHQQVTFTAAPPKEVEVNIVEYWAEVKLRLEKRFSLLEGDFPAFKSLLKLIEDRSFTRGDLTAIEIDLNACMKPEDADYPQCLEKIRAWVDNILASSAGS